MQVMQMKELDHLVDLAVGLVDRSADLADHLEVSADRLALDVHSVSADRFLADPFSADPFSADPFSVDPFSVHHFLRD